MYRLIFLLIVISSACTQPSADGVYVLDKEKLKHNITSAKNYVPGRGSERILKEIDRNELTLIIKADSAQLISTGQSEVLNKSKYKIELIGSGVKFTIENREITLMKTDSSYVLSFKRIGGVSLPPDLVELLKLDQSETDKYLNSHNNVSSKNDQKTNDLSKWTGTYMYPSGQLLIIDVTGNSIVGKTDDGKDGNVTLSEDGKVKIDGEEAFLKNDTIFYSLHGAGNSNEVILVKRWNDMH